MNALKWIDVLLKHHKTTQYKKPPNGKLPWFERLYNGDCIIRPMYIREEDTGHKNEYVHTYRTNSLWSFAHDLGLVR
jgi:hypothetical protein